ncbi:MAG: TetR/AcrR family transcriptional regulator [Gammaproteobacteria bacterium]
MAGEKAGRTNQRQRTRKDLLQAAARLMKQGRKPSLEEVAEAALVSRATAYRYFPNPEALLVEASLDVLAPEADEVLRTAPADDPVARLERVDLAFEEMIRANETALRTMLAHSLQRFGREDEEGAGLPRRQNRRTPLIEAALQPARKRFRPAALATLTKALALVVDTEARLVFRDVLQLDDAEARRIRHWVIRALVDSAMQSGRPRA